MECLAHDTKNDITLIKSHGVYYVRYGLQINGYCSLDKALSELSNCLAHALGHDPYGDDGEV